MAFVVVIAKSIFFILDTFSASSGKLQCEEEFPEWSAQHQMKICKKLWLVWYTWLTARNRRSHLQRR